jgi:hypothetical protein
MENTHTLFDNLFAEASETELSIEKKIEMVNIINGLQPVAKSSIKNLTFTSLSDIISTERMETINDRINNLHNTIFSLVRRFFLQSKNVNVNNMFQIPFSGERVEKNIVFHVNSLPAKLQNMLYLFCIRYTLDK